MSGPEKPFSCLKSGCGESFTNEDRLAVHAKKHDMELELGPKGETFVADQTPTPTRFIRNCEEVGLFQDLQNVNPFEETFKRAIESRSSTNLNLEGLTVANPDDTLHTPHIFPNLSEDNGTNIYSSGESVRSLGVQRSSSGESNNHLSVVRCLSSSIDETYHQKNKRNSESNAGEIKTIRKSLSSSKMKLQRQESIDLPDDINDVQILNNLISVDPIKGHNVSGVDSVSEGIKRTHQIPVISISEISKSDNVNANIDGEERELSSQSSIQSTLTASQVKNSSKIDPKTYLSVNSCIKNNNTKLISQKSIEIALANFTHEAQTKLMDLNNISIEDIPETSSIIKDDPKTVMETENKQSLEDQSKHLIFIQNISGQSKSAEKDEIIKSNVYHSSQVPNDIKETTNVPVVEINDRISSVNTQNGYELILKWPDGKQIYLKEINKDTNAKNLDVPSKLASDSISISATNKSVINNSVKRKLKDKIAVNSKRNSNHQTDFSTSNTHANQVVSINAFPVQNVTPDKYILVPQIINEPKIPVLPNYYIGNVVPVISQTLQKKECQIFPKEVRNSNNKPQPVIRTVLNGKICEGANQLLSTNTEISKIQSKHADTPRVTEHDVIKNQKPIHPKFVSQGKDPLVLKKMGNKAAALRYRLKGKQKQKHLMEKNESLELKNKELTQLLKLAYAEIEFLKKQLASTGQINTTAIESPSAPLQSSLNSADSNPLFGKQSVIFLSKK